MSLGVSRRRFVTASAWAIFRSHRFISACLAGGLSCLIAGCNFIRRYVGTLNRYRLKTDVGDILLDSNTVLNGRENTIWVRRFEFPADAILRTASNRPTGNEDRLLLKDIEVSIKGKFALQDFLIVPTDLSDFALMFSGEGLFPKLSDTSPISIVLHSELKLRFAQNPFSLPQKFPCVYAQWPSLNLQVFSLGKDRRSAASRTIGIDLNFANRKNEQRLAINVSFDKLVVTRPEDFVSLQMFFLGTKATNRKVYVDLPFVYADAMALSWSPGSLSFTVMFDNPAVSVAIGVQTGKQGNNSRVSHAYVKQIDVQEVDRRIVASASLEPRGASTGPDLGDQDLVATYFTVDIRGLSPSDEWALCPPEIFASTRSKPLRFQVQKQYSWPRSLKTKICPSRSASFSTLEQIYSEHESALVLAAHGLDPGNFRQIHLRAVRATLLVNAVGEGWLDCTDLSLDKEMKARYLRLGDCLVRPDSIPYIRATWNYNFSLEVGALKALQVGFQAKTITWAGTPDEVRGAWVYLGKPKSFKGDTGANIRGETLKVDSPLFLCWNFTEEAENLRPERSYIGAHHANSVLLEAIPSSSDLVPVLKIEATKEFPASGLVQIDDEIFGYQSKIDQASVLTKVSRAQLGSRVSLHSKGARVRFVVKSAEARGRIQSLNPTSLHALIEPALPENVRGSQEFLLPPFTLREHPLNDAKCQESGGGGRPAKWYWEEEVGAKPYSAAFRSQHMWEPRTRLIVSQNEGDMSSVSERFAALKKEGVSGIITFFNAGIRMTGHLLTEGASSWLPRKHNASLPAYHAIAVDQIHGTDAIDLVAPDNEFLREGKDEGGVSHPELAILTGLREPNNDSLSRAIRNPNVPIAISSVGGTIDFDWEIEKQTLGLSQLSLHSYLGRYQRNGVVVRELIYPWGLRIEQAARLFRNPQGEIEYCESWQFIQSEQIYGNHKDLRVRNLRPINGLTKKIDEPFLFKADLEFREHSSSWKVKDLYLRGHRNRNVTESIGLESAAGAKDPRTLFGDAVARVVRAEWKSYDIPPVKSPDPAVANDPNVELFSSQKCDGLKYVDWIVTTIEGEVWHTESMKLDDDRIFMKSCRAIDAENGQWCSSAASENLDSKAKDMILDGGVGRIQDPLGLGATSLNKGAFSGDYNKGEYKFERSVSLEELGLLSVLVNDTEEDKKKDVKGTLSLLYHFSNNDDGTPLGRKHSKFEGSLAFPDLTPLTKEICKRDEVKFSLAAHPKSFSSRFGTEVENKTVLAIDLGIPNFVYLRDCQFTTTQSDGLTFTAGSFELCPGVAKIIFDALFSKVSSSFGKGPKISFDLDGFDLSFPFAWPSIPLGGGSLKNLQFRFESSFRFRFAPSQEVPGKGGMFFFVGLGDFTLPRLSSLDWEGLDIQKLVDQIGFRFRPLELQFTPFVLRFGALIGFRVKTVPTLIKGIKIPRRFSAFICLFGEGGLFLGFDVGIAQGSVSIAIAIRYCPWFEYEIGKGADICISVVQVGITIDAQAIVAEIIGITIHAELMATLYLSCTRPDQMLAHLVFRGYASIKVCFVTIEYEFEVNLDNILGLHPCTPLGCTSTADATGRRELISEEALLAHSRKVLSEFYECWECVA